MSFPALLDKDLLFYDLECFKYDSLAVFSDIEGREVCHFWSNPAGKYNEPNGFEGVPAIINGKTLCGYNNYYYDDKMLCYMVQGRPQNALKRLNDELIAGKNNGKTFDIAKEIGQTIDCFQQIDASRPSLKVIEGNMGRSIIESVVPFDIDRPLTPEEKEEVLNYCRYDVRSTIEVFKQRRHGYFEPKAHLIDLLEAKHPDDERFKNAYRWNTTTISGALLLDKKISPWRNLHIPADKWRNVEGIPEEVWSMWESCEDAIAFEEMPDRQKKFKMNAFGCEFVFGFGGLHGAALQDQTFHDVLLLDVGSMYPSIIILLRILGDATEDYDGIRRQRLEIKHKDKVLSDALKLVLNSVYGNLLSEFSILYNPLASRTVCIYGQMALFDLCHELDKAGYRIVNANTDGVGFYDLDPFHEKEKPYERVWKDWQEKWGLVLELDTFRKWIQKDVNNYIAIKKDGSIKTKGGEANKAFSDKYFSNNSARIIQIGTVEAILNGTDPMDTILTHIKEPHLFQYILKAGSTFEGTVDSAGNIMQKVNRVFATRQNDDSTKLYKQRSDGGLVNFPDVPEQMRLWNGPADDVPDFTSWIDAEHYTEIIRKKALTWGVTIRKRGG